MTCVDLDGSLIWASGLINSRTPQHGDGNILVDQILREQNNNLTNGFWSLVCVDEGFVFVLLGDKGFANNYLNPNGNTTLANLILNRNTNVGQRIYFFSPTKPGGDIMDRRLNNLGADPQHLQSGLNRRLTAREANTCRAIVTSSRAVVEQAYGAHSQFRNIRKHEQIEYQFLEPLGILCPYYENMPKWWMLSMFIWEMINRYHRPFSQQYELPLGITYADIGRRMIERIEYRNPYDGLENIQFIPVLWSPTGVPYQHNRGGWTRIGGQGLLSPVTGLPPVQPVDLVEVTLGSYTLDQAQALASANRVQEVISANTYTNPVDFHIQARSILQSRECFYYDLLVQPQGWIPNIHGHFVPHRIMKITKIKSSHTGSTHYDVILAYVPYQDPNFPQMSPNRFNFQNQNLANSLMGWCCGPAKDEKCPVGARTVGCCTHVGYSLFLGMCLAHNQNLWKTKHQPINAIDINRTNMSDRARVELMVGISN